MKYIATNSNGTVLYNLTDPDTVTNLEAAGADFSDMSRIDVYMESLGVAHYYPSDGYEQGTYMRAGQWLPLPQTRWAVFEPTPNDLAASFDFPQYSLDNKRAILHKLNPEHNYEGTGSHDGGTPITPQELTDNEVIILRNSPYFTLFSETDNPFLRSDNAFAMDQIEWSKNQILNAQATLKEKSAAIALCKPVLEYLNYGFISPAYAALAAITPAGAFTADMKTELMSRFKTYLDKFPR